MPDESSIDLLTRIKSGDAAALDRLAARYFPRLRRWASRQVPSWARDFNDTEDLVQDTLVNAFRNLPNVQMAHRFSFRSYMRRAIQNRVHDELRRAMRRPDSDELSPSASDDTPSALTQYIAKEDLWRCKAALARLRASDRELILLRLSDDTLTLRAIAERTGKSSEDAARIALGRALARLAREMHRLTPLT
jgi:RNA polymerase sigma factor (sigma-70 family)